MADESWSSGLYVCLHFFLFLCLWTQPVVFTSFYVSLTYTIISLFPYFLVLLKHSSSHLCVVYLASFLLYLCLSIIFFLSFSFPKPFSQFLSLSLSLSLWSSSWILSWPVRRTAENEYSYPRRYNKAFTIEAKLDTHKNNKKFTLLLQAVWPDWAIYWTFGNFSKPMATIS